MKIDFKKLIPHGIAIAVFLIITVIYFFPLFQERDSNNMILLSGQE